MIEYRKYITRAMLRAEPDTLFVFGDNFLERGLGGQAKQMRGEPNAVGIATKRKPSMKEGAFLSDADSIEWARHSDKSFRRLFAHDGLIVWPSDDIGTGRAQLQERAPMIAKAIDSLQFVLGGRDALNSSR
jgi:hypothetical protein